MKQPKYKDIKDYIKEQIVHGKYQANDKIPTEAEFAKMFSASRQTVHKALRDLALEGLIVRYPKLGSFVSPEKPQTSILDLRAISDEVKSRGNEYSNELISLKEIRAPEAIAKIMGLVKDQKIYESQLIHKENDVPVRFDIRYILPKIAKDYIKQDFKDFTPNEYLQKHCPAEKVENSIEAVMPDDFVRIFLDLDEEPCLLISRVVRTGDEVASYSKLYYPSSRYILKSSFSY